MRARDPAARFRAAMQGDCDLKVRATYEPGLGLVVMVTDLPPGSFNPDHLAGLPFFRLLTPRGEQLWAQLHTLAHKAVNASGQPSDIAALILAPSAGEAARARRQMKEAA